VWEVAGVVYSPHEFLRVCELDIGYNDVFLLWQVKCAPSAAARARRAPCFVVCE
jgi:hypothetical protein